MLLPSRSPGLVADADGLIFVWRRTRIQKSVKILLDVLWKLCMSYSVMSLSHIVCSITAHNTLSFECLVGTVYKIHTISGNETQVCMKGNRIYLKMMTKTKTTEQMQEISCVHSSCILLVICLHAQPNPASSTFTQRKSPQVLTGDHYL